jgi:pyruvate/2-oxoacid:ferredoxin oxidoreductase alpha subunit
LVTVFGPVFSFSSAIVGAIEAGVSFFAATASGGAALSVDAVVGWLSLTLRSFVTIAPFSG